MKACPNREGSPVKACSLPVDVRRLCSRRFAGHAGESAKSPHVREFNAPLVWKKISIINYRGSISHKKVEVCGGCSAIGRNARADSGLRRLVLEDDFEPYAAL